MFNFVCKTTIYPFIHLDPAQSIALALLLNLSNPRSLAMLRADLSVISEGQRVFLCVSGGALEVGLEGAIEVGVLVEDLIILLSLLHQFCFCNCGAVLKGLQLLFPEIIWRHLGNISDNIGGLLLKISDVFR